MRRLGAGVLLKPTSAAVARSRDVEIFTVDIVWKRVRAFRTADIAEVCVLFVPFVSSLRGEVLAWCRALTVDITEIVVLHSESMNCMHTASHDAWKTQQ